MPHDREWIFHQFDGPLILLGALCLTILGKGPATCFSSLLSSCGSSCDFANAAFLFFFFIIIMQQDGARRGWPGATLAERGCGSNKQYIYWAKHDRLIDGLHEWWGRGASLSSSTSIPWLPCGLFLYRRFPLLSMRESANLGRALTRGAGTTLTSSD